MKIPITQFLRPDGRKKYLQVEIPDECFEQYRLIEKAGCYITCEQLMTLEAAQYITHEKGDFVIRITAPHNYEAAHKALIEIIKSFNMKEFETWLAGMKENDLCEI